MKTKLSVLIDPKFGMALNNLKTKEVTAAVSFQLAKISKEIDAHKDQFEITRMELLNKYGAKDKKGVLKVDSEKQSYILKEPAKFDKEFNDLLALEVEHGALPFSAIADLTIKAEILEQLIGIVISEPEL